MPNTQKPRTFFDDLVEGQLHAANKDHKGRIDLYAMRPKISTVIATFEDEEALSLIGGWPTRDQFNDAMAKRRAEFAAANVTGAAV